MIVVFFIPGNPVGYYSIIRRNWRDDRAKKYDAYKEKVRLYACKHGIKLPLTATEKNPIVIHTVACFKNRVHPDPENVHKGIVDALFEVKDKKQTRGSDKYTGGTFCFPHYADKPNAEVGVNVMIQFTEEKKE